MDPKKLQEFIQQHVQIKKDGRRGPKTKSVTEQEEPIEITRGLETFVISEDHNPTLPIDHFEMIKQPMPCEDCERVIVDRRVELKQYSFPFLHWRQRCLACSKFRNPETQKFDLNNMAAVNFWNRMHKKQSNSEPVLKKATK